ncbi:MAG: DivIVA domain-containing protein, partial [Mycobacteriales bacterium]
MQTDQPTTIWPAPAPEADPQPDDGPVPGLTTPGPEFATERRGYDRAQVDAELARLSQLLEDAEQRGRAAEERTADFERRLQETTRELVEARRSANLPVPGYQGLGKRVEEILRLAGEEAADLVERARAEAGRLTEEARATMAKEAAAAKAELAEITRRREAVLGDLRRLRELLGTAGEPAAEGDAAP